MQIPILIETLPDGRGFRAKAGDPFSVAAEAHGRGAAIDEVRRVLDTLVVTGKVVSVDVGASDPTVPLIGTLDMNDPRTQQWWRNVEDFRRESDHLTFPGEGPEDCE